MPRLWGFSFVLVFAAVLASCGGGSSADGGGGGGNQVVLRSISVSPTNQTIPMGGIQQFAATGTFSDNSTETLTSVTWSSSATGVATVSATGLATLPPLRLCRQF